MFVSKLQLKNFKRFTDLTVDLSGMQPPPKLVLMIGVNGSGKSCVFDAFEWLSRLDKNSKRPIDEAYYKKSAAAPLWAEIEDSEGRKLGGNDNLVTGDFVAKTAFYGRSAFRQVPELTVTSLTGGFNLEDDSDRPRRYIDVDNRFENDVATMVRKLVREVLGFRFDAQELLDQYITPINLALNRIFGESSNISLSLHSMLPPVQAQPVEIRFRKGVSDINYDLLSSGEKEIINILFNLHNRREFYQDTIYFIDELDVHLNTSLQYNLLKEITEQWLPGGCQLWTASHSLGFIKYAQESENAVILDFDLLDFDVPHTLTPQPKETTEIYEIAVPADVLPSLFKDKSLVLCENKNDGLYQILGFPNKVFYGVTDKNEVYYRVKNNTALWGLIDRDYMSDGEIVAIREAIPRLFVLHYYAFENYLYHPENLREAIPGFDVEAFKAEILRQKEDIYNEILLGMKQARSYKVLRDEKIENPDAPLEIANALKSDDFEIFYPFFDMKGKFNRQSLAKLNLSDSKLVRTNWFRAAIGKVFEQEEAT